LSLSFKCCVILLFASVLTPVHRAHADEWQAPTPEELSMKEEPSVPGAPAVYLYREEITDDNLHMHTVYVRLKILTDEGKKYADVEIPFEGRSFSITNVAGRTIQPDGTIVPFTGKPYTKTIVKTSTIKYEAKVFSMPDAAAGSILEYRFILRYDDNRLQPPTWYIQNELYLRKAHYKYLPYIEDGWNYVTTDRGKTAAALTWLPMLPPGSVFNHFTPPHTALAKVKDIYEVTVEKVPPAPDEEYLPPIHSLSYRFYFIYSAYTTSSEFWKKEGKYWSKQADKFMDAKDALNGMVAKLTQPSDPPEVKLKKLYDGVMAFENTDFTRERSAREDKLNGFRTVKTAQDIIDRKRGNADELTLLFVGLARAAGMKAYVLAVTNRDESMFNPNLLLLNQLDDDLAIVNVNGKDQYFDPGERYCPYGQLEWRHTMTRGLRQTDDGTDFADTPANRYQDSKTIRVAKLKLSEDGSVTGTIQVGYTGSPALAWRQEALKADQTEVERDMERAMRDTLPGGVTVKLDKVLYLDDYSKQLVATFTVDGPLATATSKRMFLPSDIFLTNEKPKFTQAKRQTPVCFHYSYEETDQAVITYPPSMTVESSPKQELFKMKALAAMSAGSSVQGNTLTESRSLAMANVIFRPDEYDGLRSFYSQVSHKDQEQAVLKLAGSNAGN